MIHLTKQILDVTSAGQQTHVQVYAYNITLYTRKHQHPEPALHDP